MKGSVFLVVLMSFAFFPSQEHTASVDMSAMVPRAQKTYHWDLWETPGLNIEASPTPTALAASWVWAFIIDVVTSVYQLSCHRASSHGHSWSEFCLVKLASSVETFKRSLPDFTGDLKWSQWDDGQEWVLLAPPCCQFSDFRMKWERYLLENAVLYWRCNRTINGNMPAKQRQDWNI